MPTIRAWRLRRINRKLAALEAELEQLNSTVRTLNPTSLPSWFVVRCGELAANVASLRELHQQLTKE